MPRLLFNTPFGCSRPRRPVHAHKSFAIHETATFLLQIGTHGVHNGSNDTLNFRRAAKIFEDVALAPVTSPNRRVPWPKSR